MNEALHSIRTFSWKGWTLLVLGGLAAAVALFYAEEDWRGWHAWNQFKHQWEAKGEKFDWQSIVPPPVPDDQNFAMAPIWVESMKAVLGPINSRRWFGDNFSENGRTNFSDRLAIGVADNEDLVSSPPQTSDGYWAKGTMFNLKLWQNYYRTLAAKTNEFPIAPQPQTPAQDVLLALSKYDSTVEELRRASLLPYSRFPVYSDADHPFDTLLPHLAELKRCAQDLKLRAIAELQNGQSEKATADVKLMLRLSESVRTEPFLISHLVRIAIFSLTLQPIYEGLAEHKWSDGQLAELETELAKLDFVADYGLAVRGEMGLQNGLFDYLRHHPEQLSNMSGSGDNKPPLPGRILTRLIPGGWFYQNQLRCAQMTVELNLPVADANQQTISPKAVNRAGATLQARIRKVTPYNFLERSIYPAFGSATKKFAYAQSSVNLVRTAIALERYRLAHGSYPESLDALAPQFIEKVPHDVIGGGPLHYRRTTDPSSQSSDAASGQFVLYSVGWNEKDDGGVVVLGKGSTPSADINQGDWVWQYPQK